MPNALGLDIGGTNLKVVLLELPNRILLDFKIPSGASEGPEEVRRSLKTAVARVRETHSFETIGVACAGSVDRAQGIVRNSPNFANWKTISIADWCEKDFGTRAQVENDAKCAVITEWKLGRGRGKKNILLLTLGTGIGGGLVLDDKLYRGTTGTAGEVGHFTLVANGVVCPCGNRGCFERYASASSLARSTPGVSPRIIFSDDRYASAVEEFLTYLEAGLVGLANVFDPEVILLGGALSQGLTRHWDRLGSFLRKHTFPAVGEKVELLPCEFGNNSGAVGAALVGAQ